MLKTADITETAERVRILVEVTPDILKLNAPREDAVKRMGRSFATAVCRTCAKYWFEFCGKKTA